MKKIILVTSIVFICYQAYTQSFKLKLRMMDGTIRDGYFLEATDTTIVISPKTLVASKTDTVHVRKIKVIEIIRKRKAAMRGAVIGGGVGAILGVVIGISSNKNSSGNSSSGNPIGDAFVFLVNGLEKGASILPGIFIGLQAGALVGLTIGSSPKKIIEVNGMRKYKNLKNELIPRTARPKKLV